MSPARLDYLFDGVTDFGVEILEHVVEEHTDLFEQGLLDTIQIGLRLSLEMVRVEALEGVDLVEEVLDVLDHQVAFLVAHFGDSVESVNDREDASGFVSLVVVVDALWTKWSLAPHDAAVVGDHVFSV